MRLAFLAVYVIPSLALAQKDLPSPIHFEQGAVNRVTIGPEVAIYSAPKQSSSIKQLLLTQARREAVGFVPESAKLFVPAREAWQFTEPEKFWAALENGRFHDYAQQSTRVPVRSYGRAVQEVTDGDELVIAGANVRVIGTPGYTRGAVSYVIDTGGRRVICTGDLIFGEGQILDLYSLQDAVPEAKARGYHGYAARAGALIDSLRKVAALRPDVLLPAHGPAIDDPEKSIPLLIDRLQTVLQSHFGTDALRWYWGDENLRIRSRAVEKPLDIMPMAEQAKLPADILAIGNSRVILSQSGAAFLVDAGYNKTLPELKRMKAAGTIQSVDGIWITHYHDDHTDYVNDVSKEFQAPVYFTQGMAEVLAHPSAFRLPCLTTRPIPVTQAKADGERLRWHEWQFTFWNFPGQTLYHGGLLATRDNGETYLFTGDSFTPSGMDDYCMQNRDFLREGEGYAYCLRKIATLPPHTWLLNQHVEPMFRFTEAQIARMKNEWQKRSVALAGLSPWPDINYLVDESWARAFPYGQETQVGKVFDVSMRIRNHGPRETVYRLRWHAPPGLALVSGAEEVTVGARKEGEAKAQFRATTAGLHVITTDVAFERWQLQEWAEAMVRVKD